jgi:hypothetical protein
MRFSHGSRVLIASHHENLSDCLRIENVIMITCVLIAQESYSAHLALRGRGQGLDAPQPARTLHSYATRVQAIATIETSSH